MLGNSYGDPLRPLDSLEGILPNLNDLVQEEHLSHGAKDDLNTAKLKTLTSLRDTALSVENLYINEDFKRLIDHITKMISICERYVYSPQITQEAKSAWFNQLNILKGFINVVRYFQINNSQVFEEEIAVHRAGLEETLLQEQE